MKLPKDFHGKPRQKMPTIHKKKREAWQNPEIGKLKLSNWPKQALDQDVLKERKEMITSTS